MSYGPPLPTPVDLQRAGIAIVTHTLTGYCWQRRNAYGPGTIYGASWPTAAQAIDDARHHARVTVQMEFFEVTR